MLGGGLEHLPVKECFSVFILNIHFLYKIYRFHGYSSAPRRSLAAETRFSRVFFFVASFDTEGLPITLDAYFPHVSGCGHCSFRGKQSLCRYMNHHG